MKDLNDLKAIKKLDPKNVYGSTGMLADQCEQIWEDIGAVNLPKIKVKNIVISGMGGSSYGAHIIESVYVDELQIPMVVLNDYHLPAFAESDTLVLVTSYSGTTEETLSVVKEAKERQCQIVILTSGGEMGRMVNEGGTSGFVFDPKNNPCGQPRLGTGYIILGTIALLNKVGLINVTDKEIINAVALLRSSNKEIEETAKKLSFEFDDRIPLIIAADFLKGNAHILRNQMNETAKSFSNFSRLPELNHHLMEGLKYPKDAKLSALFLTSNFYNDRIIRRVELTKDVISKNYIPVFEYQAQGMNKIEQVLNVLSFGGYLSLYLALIYDEDPSLIPWVDYFKEQLKK